MGPYFSIIGMVKKANISSDYIEKMYETMNNCGFHISKIYNHTEILSNCDIIATNQNQLNRWSKEIYNVNLNYSSLQILFKNESFSYLRSYFFSEKTETEFRFLIPESQVFDLKKIGRNVSEESNERVYRFFTTFL